MWWFLKQRGEKRLGCNASRSDQVSKRSATKSAVATRRIIGQVVRARIMKITIGRKNILIDEVSTSSGILVVEEGQQQCLSDVGACTLTDSSIFRHAQVACGLAGLSWLSRYNSGTIIT